ncbi:MAG: hypothetical protein IPJ65_05470 [Archangiaceae bacterium]|nr:hypothetical protein [Archangiaceae bacterium]
MRRQAQPFGEQRHQHGGERVQQQVGEVKAEGLAAERVVEREGERGEGPVEAGARVGAGEQRRQLARRRQRGALLEVLRGRAR